MAEIKTDKNASRASDQDPMDGVSRITSLRTTRQDLSGLFLIQQPRLNHNNSHS